MWQGGRVMISPEQVRLVSGASAPILLLGGAPVHDALPVLRVVDGAVPGLDGWSVFARLTMCVLDGPGDAGCLFPTLGGSFGTDGVARWCDEVERAGGALVVSLADAAELTGPVDWPALLDGGSRGGFAAAAG
ncbi:hypothetical protein Kpho02_14540 [Kitasatospora phosalacinea]|uniref:Uncharacterized protein n=2 Tax=Kitasatospora phosalacinea TaxID=2065 RepID=A0A9W6V1P5_9ACTN|nr:hypothetical protein Kpho02_14540 [Kitasatospora phosalacinea]